MKSQRLHLQHIIEGVERIHEYTAGDRSRFEAELKTRDAVLRCLQTLTQAALSLPEDVQAQCPEIDWQALRGFRNILVHEYLEVSLELTWAVIMEDLPVLRAAAECILAEDTDR